ncbi:hypothetical protein HGRIS_004072 [Hohenbuehelia grisea]|uniref:Proteophosphoglycan ppg4 n=1 Tax=Hohenbuehelia grisea TaxID=104357 RepID=A0ABR3JHR2_9AGAR
MATRRVITYAHRRSRPTLATGSRNSTAEAAHSKSATPSPIPGDDHGDEIRNTEDMTRPFLKRSRSSGSHPLKLRQSSDAAGSKAADGGKAGTIPKRDTDLDRVVDAPVNPEIDLPVPREVPFAISNPALAYQTPLPTDISALEAFHLPSGLGEPILPEQFSPLPKVALSQRPLAKASRRMAPKERLKPIDTESGRKWPERNLVRTKSGKLKENVRRPEDPGDSRKSKKISVSKSAMAKDLGHVSGGIALPLSSPFSSRPGSVESSPKHQQPKKTKPGTAYMRSSERRPLAVRFPSRSNNFAVLDIDPVMSRSTATSPAHSDVASKVTLDKERRPSVPTTTRPTLATFHEPRKPTNKTTFNAETGNGDIPPDARPVSALGHHGMVNSALPSPNWATLGISFDRPPSQLDYTLTCAFNDFAETGEFGDPADRGTDFSAFWDGAMGISTPLDRDKARSTGLEIDEGRAHREIGDRHDRPAHDDYEVTMFPFQRPGYVTPDVPPFMNASNSLPSLFPPANHPDGRSSHFSSPSEYDSDEEGRDNGMDITHAGAAQSPWLSDSLISPPSVYTKKPGAFERPPSTHPLDFMTQKHYGQHRGSSEVPLDPTLYVHAYDQDYVVPVGPTKERSVITKEFAHPDQVVPGKSNVSPRGPSPTANGERHDAGDQSVDPRRPLGAEEPTELPESLEKRSLSVPKPADSTLAQGRNRRNTIKASDFETNAPQISNLSVTVNARRTRSGTITARNPGVAQPGITTGNHNPTQAARRTRSGTVVGPPARAKPSAAQTLQPTSSNTVTSHLEAGPPSSDDPISILGPSIDLNDEVWAVAPRTSPLAPRKRHNLRPLSSLLGPRSGKKLSVQLGLDVMHEGPEDLRSSDDELLLKDGDPFW